MVQELYGRFVYRGICFNKYGGMIKGNQIGRNLGDSGIQSVN